VTHPRSRGRPGQMVNSGQEGKDAKRRIPEFTSFEVHHLQGRHISSSQRDEPRCQVTTSNRRARCHRVDSLPKQRLQPITIKAVRVRAAEPSHAF